MVTAGASGLSSFKPNAETLSTTSDTTSKQQTAASSRRARESAKCLVCSKPMRVKRAGRQRHFCSPKCRQAAYRDRAFRRKFRAASYDPSRALQNAPKNPTNSIGFEPQNRGRGSLFGPRDWPIDLVGGHRGGRRLQPDLTATIFSVELRAARVTS
jgi:hypothetical protein